MADTFKVDGADKVTGASKTKNTSFGWSDPSGELPLPEYHYEPSLNKAVTKGQGYTIDIKGGDPSINITDLVGKMGGNSLYGNVSVKQTKSGHVLVFDDSPDNESVLIKHKDGSGFVLKADGTMVMNTKRNRVTSIGGTDALIVEGDIEISCQNLKIDATGDMDMNVGGDYNLTVGGEKKETISGSSKEVITGNKTSTVVKSRSETTVENKTTTVFGNDTNITKGNVTYSIGGHFDLGAKSYSKITSQAQIAYSAPQIDIVGIKGQIALHHGIFGGENSYYYGLNYYGRSAKFTKGVTATNFTGDLTGTADKSIITSKQDYAENLTARVVDGVTTLYTNTDTDTDLTRENKGPSDNSIGAILTGDPRGVKKISIDDPGDLQQKFVKKKYTVEQARAILKDTIKSIDNKFLKELIEQGVLGDAYFSKVMPGFGRVTNGNTAYVPYKSTTVNGNITFISGKRMNRPFMPDSTFDPNRFDPRGGINTITSRTLLALGLPISTFLAGINGASTLGHLDSFEKRQKLARQLMLQTEVIKMCKDDEDRFKSFKLVVAEGVSKETHTSGSIPDLRTSGRAITYELYDMDNRNLSDVTYEFATHLADQLPVYDKIIIDYDTVDPKGGNTFWEKVNSQIIVVMPEVDKGYAITGRASFNLETRYNNQVQTNTDLVELTQSGTSAIILASSSPFKDGFQYSSTDFPLSAYRSSNATKINQLHPLIRKRFVDAINDFLNRHNVDGWDIAVNDAYRSYAEQAKLNKDDSKLVAAPGNSFHQYGLAIDVLLYKDGIADDGSKTNRYYTGILRSSFNKFGLTNFFGNDSGHFHPEEFGKTVPNTLREGTISIEDYINSFKST